MLLHCGQPSHLSIQDLCATGIWSAIWAVSFNQMPVLNLDPAKAKGQTNDPRIPVDQQRRLE